jgi:hypothetical protein
MAYKKSETDRGMDRLNDFKEVSFKDLKTGIEEIRSDF